MPIKINGATSGSLTIKAPDTGTDQEVELVGALAAKAPTASPTFTGNMVWSGATLRTGFAQTTTSQSTTSATYTDLATAGPAVTVSTGTKALVIVTGYVLAPTAGASAFMSVAISGATTTAASDDWSIQVQSGAANTLISVSRAFLFTFLTAGSNTFTTKYRNGGGASANFANRSITVVDMGS